jgi:hypothetical protein
VTRTIYLPSYDRYDDILEYQLPEGTFTVLSRHEFTLRSHALTFGSFTREGQHVAGVFASPQGPIFFLDSRYLVGRLGATSSSVRVDGETMHFTLTHEEKIEFELTYQERIGIGTNPYDNEQEDVDLLAMLAAGMRKEQFFRNYIREWVDSLKQ